MSPRPPKNSAQMARKANGAGIPIFRKEPHGAVESVAAKPAQHLLRAVREEHNAQHQAHNGQSEIVRSGESLRTNILLNDRPQAIAKLRSDIAPY